LSVLEPILSVNGLKVELGGIQVLDIPSFQLQDKEIVTIVGPNGSGKSTLLLTLACLLPPLAGKISFRGEPIGSHETAFRYRRKISMVFQDPLLFDTTVYKNVAAGLKFRNLSKSDINARVIKYLKCFQCAHLAGRSARKLSGGESQRISLARAFAIEPEILFLDEPFSSLDPPTRHALIHDLNTIIKETGTTTIMVTHVESEAMRMSGRIIVMNDGKIIQTGSPAQVINNPLNEFVAKFVGMETILNGRVLERRAESLVISVLGREIYAGSQGHPGEEVTCCIRPENIDISLKRADDSSVTRNVFNGRITDVYSIGPYLKVSIDCGFPLVSLVTREMFTDMELAEGKEICASFKPSSVHLINKQPLKGS